jgi:hypothetical protein
MTHERDSPTLCLLDPKKLSTNQGWCIQKTARKRTIIAAFSCSGAAFLHLKMITGYIYQAAVLSLSKGGF